MRILLLVSCVAFAPVIVAGCGGGSDNAGSPGAGASGGGGGAGAFGAKGGAGGEGGAVAKGGASGGGTAGGSGSAGNGTSGASGKGTGGAAAGGSAGGAGKGASGNGGSTGGNGGGGMGMGGSAPACLDPSTYSGTFTIVDSELCAVAVYQADEALGFQAPSWGKHQGPLTVVADAGGGVTLTRWKAPATAIGTLTKQTTHVSAAVPAGAFVGAKANDLPFFGWTAISWTAQTPPTGAIVTIAGSSVAQSYATNTPYSVWGISGGNMEGRLLHTGLSALGANGTANGLYQADACATPKQDLGAGQGCGAPALVAAWGDDPGPIGLDEQGNAFVVQGSVASGTQEARAFSASEIARGAPPTKGTKLFTVPGYAGGLAAIAPTAVKPGIVVFQPFDATTFDALDVIAQRYSVAAGVVATGTPTTLLKVTQGKTGLAVMRDDTGRLWVAAPAMSATTYVVLARVP